MTEKTREMIELIDEVQVFGMKALIESDALAEIAGEEEAIKALALGTKAIKVSKEYALAQAEWYDKTDRKIERIEKLISLTVENQKIMFLEFKELNSKLDKLIKEFEKLNEPTVEEA